MIRIISIEYVVNYSKFLHGMTQVKYLGYIIDEQGVHVDPAKIKVIRD